MPGRIWASEQKYNIIMKLFQNTNITIAEICRYRGMAGTLFYKRKGQFLEGKDADGALIKENEKLKSVIGEMTSANEILKNYNNSIKFNKNKYATSCKITEWPILYNIFHG